VKRVAVIIGTRPEAIKTAPVLQALATARDLQPVLVSTGQHRELLDEALEFFQLRPDHDLRIMRPDQDLGQLTGRVLAGLGGIFRRDRPDMVLVHGDTVTSFAGALAAFYQRLPVAHLEAGLRTRNLDAPFPEEATRQMTARLAALHFAPTARSREALLAEGVPSDRIRITGNTVVDALLWTARRLRGHPELGRLSSLPTDRPWVLITGHRRENFGPALAQTCHELARLADVRPDLLLVYPVHPNPNVRRPVEAILGGRLNVRLIPPQPYPVFVRLMLGATLIITDSGGVQEEAPSLGIPVLVTREVTERGELLDTGQVALAGREPGQLLAAALHALAQPRSPWSGEPQPNPCGDGRAADRVLAGLREFLCC
jgi:UDP-N-acetylglucosamine 2-epimerase (non-hydrolysing)